jgi:hypothetical protein
MWTRRTRDEVNPHRANACPQRTAEQIVAIVQGVAFYRRPGFIRALANSPLTFREDGIGMVFSARHRSIGTQARSDRRSDSRRLRCSWALAHLVDKSINECCESASSWHSSRPSGTIYDTWIEHG